MHEHTQSLNWDYAAQLILNLMEGLLHDQYTSTLTCLHTRTHTTQTHPGSSLAGYAAQLILSLMEGVARRHLHARQMSHLEAPLPAPAAQQQRRKQGARGSMGVGGVSAATAPAGGTQVLHC